MEALKKARQNKGLSQRNLAERATLSYKTLQLVEAGATDPRLSTLERLAAALGYPSHIIESKIQEIFQLPPDSVFMMSVHLCREGESSWKIWLFNFVDAFRRDPTPTHILHPPLAETPIRLKALITSTVETLCAELGIETPWWCDAVLGLAEPWFVAGVENLKAMALVESPVHFRKRNIFVLANFLERT